MFVCYECLETFNEPKIWTETHGLNTGPYEVFSGCPYCGGAFTESHKCDCCDEWIVNSYIRLNSGERICENCYTTHEIGEE